MWYFQDFFVPQILREINTESRGSKTATFGHLKASEFCSFSKIQPSKSAKIHKYQNSETLNQ